MGVRWAQLAAPDDEGLLVSGKGQAMCKCTLWSSCRDAPYGGLACADRTLGLILSEVNILTESFTDLMQNSSYRVV